MCPYRLSSIVHRQTSLCLTLVRYTIYNQEMLVPPRFSRPRLIGADDKQYRAFLAQIMLGKENQRAIRPPRERDLFGGEAEAALRDWLAQRYTLSERRIVEYLEHRSRSAVKKYRELDAVVIPTPKTIQVFE